MITARDGPSFAVGITKWFDACMGMAKNYAEEVDSRGWADVGTTICSRCVIEQALVDAIEAHGETAPCDYCEVAPSPPHASAPIELLLKLIVDGLRLEYEDPIHQMGWDGGYTGAVHDTWDLLWDFEITGRDEVHEVLHDAIVTSSWCQRNPYEYSPSQALLRGWDAFRNYVKHHRRFTFLARDQSFQDGAGAIPMHAMPSAIASAVRESGLLKSLKDQTEWWRIRPHGRGESYSLAADLGTPPDTVARDNRMTPKGIGAFYGASTRQGAIAEVSGYASPSSGGSMGKFHTVVPLTIVDLRDLPAVPSLFDAERRHVRAPIEFMHGFVRDVTKIADPTDEMNLNYVPTQVVSETFRFELGADGVFWRSTKDETVTSCVLFIPCNAVADQGAEVMETRLVLDPSTVEHVADIQAMMR